MTSTTGMLAAPGLPTSPPPSGFDSCPKRFPNRCNCVFCVLVISGVEVEGLILEEDAVTCLVFEGT